MNEKRYSEQPRCVNGPLRGLHSEKGAQAERAYYVQHWNDATLRQPIQSAKGRSDKGNNSNDETIVQNITEKGD